MYFFFSLASFPTFLRSALCEQRLNFFIRLSNSKGGYPSTQGTIGIWKSASLLGSICIIQFSHVQNRWVTLLCAHVIKKLIHSRIYFSRIASRSAKFAKFESLENYALYGNCSCMLYCIIITDLGTLKFSI